MYSAPQNRQAVTRTLFHDNKVFYCDCGSQNEQLRITKA